MAIMEIMAITTIRTTYALDEATVRALEQMAARWGVSKSEALRRAISSASEEKGSGPADAVEALDELQKSLGLTQRQADAWVRSVRAERRAWRRKGRSAG